MSPWKDTFETLMYVFIIFCIFIGIICFAMIPDTNDAPENILSSKDEKISVSTYKQYISPPETLELQLPEVPEFTLNEIQQEEIHEYRITYCANLIYNESVGNSWGYGINYNGSHVSSGSTVSVKVSPFSDTWSIKASATEYDNYNDNGSTTVMLPILNVQETHYEEVIVTVRENRGRYSGNSAQWKFFVTIERIS